LEAGVAFAARSVATVGAALGAAAVGYANLRLARNVQTEVCPRKLSAFGDVETEVCPRDLRPSRGVGDAVGQVSARYVSFLRFSAGS